MYDAVAEFRVKQLLRGEIQPDSVRNLKEMLMRVRIHRNDTANYNVQIEAVAALKQDMGDAK